MSKAIKSYWIISKRTRWGLTIWGWLTILMIVILSGFFFMTQVYSLLAPTRPVNADVLVVEGAVPDYILDSAMAEFHRNHYKLLITTGTPLEWGHLLIDYGNTASIAASSLKKLGFDTTMLIAVATDEIRNDRTYNSALELGRFLKMFYPEVKAINLMSYGPHGCRSQLMFQAALGDSIQVGIISVKSFYYGSETWWKSSKGFREVMNEFLGYTFVKLFFVPYSLDDGG